MRVRDSVRNGRFDELYERARYLIQADFETAKADIGI